MGRRPGPLTGSLIRLEPAVGAESCAQLRRCVDMLSGVSRLLADATGVRDFLAAACELAVATGGYAASAALLFDDEEGPPTARCVACASADPELSERLRIEITAALHRRGSMVNRALQKGETCVCESPSDQQATAHLQLLMLRLGVESAIALPLLSETKPVGLLFLVASASGAFSADEEELLQHVAATLSFAIRSFRQQVAIRRLSSFDPQTALARRTLFCERIEGHLRQIVRSHCYLAVMVLDIERLSVINDSMGRAGGDQVLKLVGLRLSQVYGPQRVAHFGGGTFAVYVDTGAFRPCEQVFRRVASVFDLPYTVEGVELSVSVRVGAASYPGDARAADRLVQSAESALRDARTHGERTLAFSAQKHLEVVDHLMMEHRLRSAFKRREFRLHYQPQVDTVTGRITGAEALLRWTDEQLGNVAPTVFLPVIESRGLMGELGGWIAQQAAEDLRDWRRGGLPPLRVAVNVSTSQLRMSDFCETFQRACGSWREDAWGLDIEITEGALQDGAEREIGKLAQLRSRGVRVAIDDFGTGYSSLARLISLPVDILKIDRSFIPRESADVGKLALLRTIVGIGKALNMSTVAEGVETDEQLFLLRSTGCHQYQGFLHSRPMAAVDFRQFIQDNCREDR
jgi:diguanylate cyclase (GGDEF)-like protein